MPHLNSPQLKLTYVRANGPDPDDTVNEYLVFPGGGEEDINNGILDAYASLKGSAANMDWPQGTTTVPFVNSAFNANNLLTDTFGEQYGVRSWSITAEPSHIPGLLQIAYYLDTNTDDATPDSTADFSLDVGAWSTGALFVFTGLSTAAYYRTPRFRFIPGPLIGPLGV